MESTPDGLDSEKHCFIFQIC